MVTVTLQGNLKGAASRVRLCDAQVRARRPRQRSSPDSEFIARLLASGDSAAGTSPRPAPPGAARAHTQARSTESGQLKGCIRRRGLPGTSMRVGVPIRVGVPATIPGLTGLILGIRSRILSCRTVRCFQHRSRLSHKSLPRLSVRGPV